MAYIYDLTDTWNAGGTTFYGIKMNVTNTASAAGSKLLSLQVGGSEQFGVDKNGAGYFSGNVGIGTTAPGVKLDVIGTVRSNSFTATGTTAFQPQTTMVNHAADATGGYYIFHKGRAGGTTSQNGDTLGTLLWYGHDSGNALVATSSISVAQTGAASAGVVPSALIFSNVGNIECMRINSSGNVGIGTSAPGYRLAVNGGDILVSRGSGAAAADGAINFGGNANNYIYSGNSSNVMVFATNGSERMRITGTGDVGIGTIAPGAKLDVAGTIRTSAGGTDPGSGAAMYFVGSGAFQTVVAGAEFAVNTGNNNARTERMRIDSSGNVGIGTSSPATKLQVSAASGYNEIRVTSGSNSLGLAIDGSVAYLAAFQSMPLTFQTNSAERMRITAAGNLQLGTASLATNATNGFPYIPTCAGTPTGTPTAITGYAPMVVDSTNNKLYVYVGGAWQAMN